MSKVFQAGAFVRVTIKEGATTSVDAIHRYLGPGVNGRHLVQGEDGATLKAYDDELSWYAPAHYSSLKQLFDEGEKKVARDTLVDTALDEGILNLASASTAVRKNTPIFSGLLAYFPDACAAVARLSKIGNDKHNPGKPMHWAREKSTDHHDCVARHLMDVEAIDPDTGLPHAVHLAWRALALAQLTLEKIAAEQYPATHSPANEPATSTDGSDTPPS